MIRARTKPPNEPILCCAHILATSFHSVLYVECLQSVVVLSLTIHLECDEPRADVTHIIYTRLFAKICVFLSGACVYIYVDTLASRNSSKYVSKVSFNVYIYVL